jgi:hypothetical protein
MNGATRQAFTTRQISRSGACQDTLLYLEDHVQPQRTVGVVRKRAEAREEIPHDVFTAYAAVIMDRYSITSSARPSNLIGKVRPSVLVVVGVLMVI